jgi:hypothetical protein
MVPGDFRFRPGSSGKFRLNLCRSFRWNLFCSTALPGFRVLEGGQHLLKQGGHFPGVFDRLADFDLALVVKVDDPKGENQNGGQQAKA